MATSHLLCAGTEACADEVDLKQLSELDKGHKQIWSKQLQKGQSFDFPKTSKI